MKRIGTLLGSLLVVSIFTCLSLSAFAANTRLRANLTAAAEVPPTTGHGHGTLRATFNSDTNVLTYHITFSGLTGPAIAAHFHGPALAGADAGPQVPIDTKPIVSPINGKATLTADQAQDLLAGKWYFNIHTAQNKGGEVRGQIEASK